METHGGALVPYGTRAPKELLHHRPTLIPRRPSVSADRFDHDELDPQQHHRAVLSLAEHIGAALRDDRQVAQGLTLTVTYADHSHTTRTRSLTEATAPPPSPEPPANCSPPSASNAPASDPSPYEPSASSPPRQRSTSSPSGPTTTGPGTSRRPLTAPAPGSAPGSSAVPPHTATPADHTPHAAAPDRPGAGQRLPQTQPSPLPPGQEPDLRRRDPPVLPLAPAPTSHRARILRRRACPLRHRRVNPMSF
ncbi:hypothetical protein [Streptomyces sp. NPDC058671]|uniref:DinB/UmuC family translesion DNA polymerase n=1 Tax=Streptomyces sp. NPDC058671 TaxID=3346590 RepID=UPI00365D1F68